MRPPDSLKQVAERALAGEPWRSAVRDFLDGFTTATHDEAQLIDDEPPTFDEVGEREVLAPHP